MVGQTVAMQDAPNRQHDPDDMYYQCRCACPRHCRKTNERHGHHFNCIGVGSDCKGQGFMPTIANHHFMRAALFDDKNDQPDQHDDVEANIQGYGFKAIHHISPKHFCSVAALSDGYQKVKARIKMQSILQHKYEVFAATLILCVGGLGERNMLPFIVSGVVLAALCMMGAYVGVRLASVVREQFDELMPQRMIDYSGFVCVEPAKD